MTFSFSLAPVSMSFTLFLQTISAAYLGRCRAPPERSPNPWCMVCVGYYQYLHAALGRARPLSNLKVAWGNLIVRVGRR